MPPKWRHKCPETREVEIVNIDGWKIVGWTILVALWWRAINTTMDIAEFLMELLLERWIP